MTGKTVTQHASQARAGLVDDDDDDESCLALEFEMKNACNKK